MPENNQRRERVFDNPGKFVQLVRDACITHGIQTEVIEVNRDGQAGAGMGLYLYGRPQGVTEGHYEKLHVLGMDVTAKLAAALIVVGTNTWGQQFSGPVDEMLRDPKTIPGMATESGIVLPGIGLAGSIRARKGR